MTEREKYNRARAILKAKSGSALSKMPKEIPPRYIRRNKLYKNREKLGLSRDWLLDRLFRAFLKARVRKQRSRDEFEFEMNYWENIERLADDILYWTYQTSSGVSFVVEEPVAREIVAAPFRDRVIHHLLYDDLALWVDKRLIHTSSSCRPHRGTLFGVQQLAKDIRQVSRGYTQEAWAIQLDIQGYFMSLPRKKLFRCALSFLKRKYPYGGKKFQMYKFLWYQIIMDNPVEGITMRPPYSSWNKLLPNKSLFCQEPGIGIVIGNLSSQLLSNLYLHALDVYVTQVLRHKHYGRYVDDFYIIATPEEKPQAIKDIAKIEEFLASMGLKLHPDKRHIQEVHKGVRFLGMVVQPFGIVPGKRFKDNFYRAVQLYAMGYKKDDSMLSYMGFCKRVRGQMLCYRVFKSVGWDYKFSDYSGERIEKYRF